MKDHIVLVEPNYYSKFPPLGLLKLSSLEKSKGNSTELVRKNSMPHKRPDKIYITSLFTWAWRAVWQSVRIYKAWYPDVNILLGGLYASLMPEHAKLSGADNIYVGLHEEAEDIIPDYSLVPDWNGSIIFASRGCVNNCLNCVVPKLEGKICHEHRSIKKFIYKDHSKLIFFDNNILAMQYWKDIFKEILEIGLEVDFNQGLEARLITDEAATLISKMKIPRVRLAYDNAAQKEYVKEAINLLGKRGIKKRQILVYSMFNFTETTDDFLNRVRDILNWGAVCYPMRFQPVNTLKKDSYISPKWTEEQLNSIAAARRVIGYGGAFPPYEGLKKKFEKASSFEEAFELYPRTQ